MKIAALHYYPVKSMRGLSTDTLMLHARGFEHDRIWIVADPTGRFITARTHPHMVLWQAQPTPNGLLLTTPSGQQHQVFYRDYTHGHEVTVWQDIFTAYQGLPCRLLYLGTPSHRTLAHNHNELSFADGAPYLLTNTASLTALNALLPHSVDMRRFRANIVITGDTPYAEDSWHYIQIGEAILENVKPCSRCVLITVDPDTGLKNTATEPLKTLARTRKSADGVCFGVNLALACPGRISVGDTATVES